LYRIELEGRRDIQVLIQSLPDKEISTFFGAEALQEEWTGEKQRLETAIARTLEEEQQIYQMKKL
jgi:hypothetical protein